MQVSTTTHRTRRSTGVRLPTAAGGPGSPGQAPGRGRPEAEQLADLDRHGLAAPGVVGSVAVGALVVLGLLVAPAGPWAVAAVVLLVPFAAIALLLMAVRDATPAPGGQAWSAGHPDQAGPLHQG